MTIRNTLRREKAHNFPNTVELARSEWDRDDADAIGASFTRSERRTAACARVGIHGHVDGNDAPQQGRIAPLARPVWHPPAT
jgi:hypothetical protein